MTSKFRQAALLLAGTLALGACKLDGANTAAPVKKPPASDYQATAPNVPPPANIRAICYTEADLATVRARMLHQELVVATLQCQNPGGARAFDSIYGTYLTKFNPELSTNGRAMTQLAGRKRFNLDVIVTEFSNRMAQYAPTDKDFCPRSLRALEWALDPKVTTLSQAPPPYDLGPEMNIFPCPAK